MKTIKSLDTQISDKAYQVASLDARSNDLQSNFYTQIKDLQFKVNRHESSLSKTESDHHSMSNAIRDLQSQFQDNHRNTMLRINETDKRISELNTKFDSILMEQTMV